MHLKNSLKLKYKRVDSLKNKYSTWVFIVVDMMECENRSRTFLNGNEHYAQRFGYEVLPM